MISDVKNKEGNPELLLERLVAVKRFSTFKGLLRIASLVLKFIKKCKGIKDSEKKLNDVCFIEESKTLWFRYLQTYVTVNRYKFKKAKESLELSNTSVKACTYAEITSSITKRS